MRLEEAIKLMFILACIITVGLILLVSAIAIVCESDSSVYIQHLYRYPLMAVSSVMPVLFFVNSERATVVGLRIRVILHFFFTAVAVLGSSTYHIYRWMRISIRLEFLIFKILVFIGIYGGAWWAIEHQQQNLSDELNNRISEFRDSD